MDLRTRRQHGLAPAARRRIGRPPAAPSAEYVLRPQRWRASLSVPLSRPSGLGGSDALLLCADLRKRHRRDTKRLRFVQGGSGGVAAQTLAFTRKG
jgi:hypothetical protein